MRTFVQQTSQQLKSEGKFLCERPTRFPTFLQASVWKALCTVQPTLFPENFTKYVGKINISQPSNLQNRRKYSPLDSWNFSSQQPLIYLFK